MCCAVATKDVVSQRKKGFPVLASTPPAPSSTETMVPIRRRNLIKGAFWADEHTAPISKFPYPLPQKGETKKKKDVKIRELTEVEDISLRKLVRKAMQSVESRHMKALPANLKAADKVKLGLIPPTKFREIIQKNQILLGEAAFRNLCRKFGEAVEETHLVRYDKVVPFFSKLWSEAADLPKKKPSTPPVGGFSNYSDRVGGKSYVPSYFSTQQNDYQSRRRYVVLDEAVFIKDLQHALLTSEGNLESIGSVMRGFDQQLTGYLNEGQVYAVFQQCGIFIPSEVFQQLLQATDVTRTGTYDIGTLLHYIICAVPDLAHVLAYDAVYYPPQVDVSNPTSFSNRLAPYNQNLPYPPSNLNQNSGASTSGNSIGNELATETSDVNVFINKNKWNEDFKRLVEALHDADEGKIGFMPEPDIHNLSSTYNQVYNLGLSDSEINAALRKSLDSKYNEINIDHFASSLRQLHV